MTRGAASARGEPDRELPGDPASLTMSAVLARIDAPSVITAMRASSHGVSAGPATPAAWPRRSPARRRRARRRRGGHPLPGPGRRRGSPPPRPRPSWARDQVRRCSEVRDGCRRGDPRRAGVEPGQVGLADGHDRHAPCLEVLEGRRHVEDRLRAGTDDGHRAFGRAPRGRTRCRRWASTRRRRSRRGRRGGRHRSRRSRRPRSPRRGRRSSWPRPSWPPSRRRRAPRRGSAVPPCAPNLRGPWPVPCRARVVEADEQPPVMDRDRRRDRAGGADRGLRRLGDLDVLRVRQAVADQGRFRGRRPAGPRPGRPRPPG